MTTTPDSIAIAADIPYGLLGVDPLLFFNVLEFGAIGDGAVDDTEALLAVLADTPSTGGTVFLPAGYTFLFSATLLTKSNTTITGGGTLKAAPLTSWRGSTYRGISNVNYGASALTDVNITINDITIDYTLMGDAGGLGHCIYFRYVRRVRVENCTVISGASSCALLGCDDTLELGNRYLSFLNCGSDHWTSPSNNRVVGCHIETDASSQMVNFNPENSDLTGTGHVADGFVMTGCTIVSHENSATPSQIEPLATGNTVKNVVITGNKFVNASIVMRGDVRGAIVSGNTFSDFQGTSEVVTGYSQFGVFPSAISISGNVVRDPTTSSANVAVLRCTSDSASIFGNIIMGTTYTASACSVGSTLGQIFGNYVEKGAINGALQSGFRFPNGSANYIGWTDASGSLPRIFIQSDNTWTVASTDDAGAQRNVFSIAARSSTSELRYSVPILFNGSYTRVAPASVAAAGSTIATATSLTANINYVISATAVTAIGVALHPVDGQQQTVINTTAITINVYPNNSGTAQIDAGGANIPATIAAGKSKTFTRVVAGDFRTVAAT